MNGTTIDQQDGTVAHIKVGEKWRGRSGPQSTQYRLFRWVWYHPTGYLSQAAKDLGISYFAARHAASRLRRSHIVERLCPDCFKPARHDLLCYSCGADFSRTFAPMRYDPESQNPVFSIQPGNGLGSVLTPPPGLTNSRAIIRQQVMKAVVKDQQFEKARSELLEFLKSTSPPERVTEIAYKLLKAEFGEFRTRYPSVKIGTAVREQLVRNVQKRLQLMFPAFIRRREAKTETAY